MLPGPRTEASQGHCCLACGRRHRPVVQALMLGQSSWMYLWMMAPAALNPLTSVCHPSDLLQLLTENGKNSRRFRQSAACTCLQCMETAGHHALVQGAEHISAMDHTISGPSAGTDHDTRPTCEMCNQDCRTPGLGCQLAWLFDACKVKPM